MARTNSRLVRAATAAAAAGAAGLVAATGACAPDDGGDETLTVFAAASLGDSFTQIAEEFEAANPGVDVVLSFDGSQNLVDQIASGAPVDVLATADERTMDRAVGAGDVVKPQRFATNTLTIIVPDGNPAGITGLDDSLKGKKLVICAPEVPCGAATEKVAAATGVELEPVSEEQKVSDVRGKVESGQADVGIVYRTDAAAAADRTDEIELAGADAAVNDYPIARTTRTDESGTAATADEFIAFVLSDRGQAILAGDGFGAK